MSEDKKNKEGILRLARDRAQLADKGWSVNFTQMEEDIDFLHGDQWPDAVRNDRSDEGRPILTFNKLPSMLDQVVGDQRQSRPQIKIIPTQGDNEKINNAAGTKDYSRAEVFSGLIRNIEYSSRADIAYDTAYEHAAGWGLGWIHLTTDYSHDDTFEQDFKIKRVRNWKAVLSDPTFEEPDGSDQMYNFYFSKIHKDEFRRRWPGKEIVDTDLNLGDEFSYWLEGEYVRVASYYDRVPIKKKIVLMSNGEVYDADKLENIGDELEQMGITQVRDREVDTHKVIWRKISGVDILDEQETIFTHIPMVPVLGKELMIRGDIYYRGVVRHAKDAQRMYNYSRTAQIERVALEPKSPYIVTKGQIKGFEDYWDNANAKNQPYLVVNETKEGLPQRQFPAQVSQGDTQLSLQASDDIKSTMGMYDASLGAQSNETSGKAIMARQREGDVGNYAFIDNLTRSLEHLGKMLVDGIPKIYDTARQLRIRFPDDTEDFVEINKTIMDEQTGTQYLIHDLSQGKFDVRVDSGPSYTTQRQEALEQMERVLQSNPDLWNIIGDLLAKNMDWPGADEFAERLKKMVPPDLLDDPEEDEPKEPAPPTPGEQIEMSRIQLEQQKLEADGKKVEATVVQAEADMAEAQAKMMQAVEKINNLDENIKASVAEAIAQAYLQMSQ